MCLLLFGIVLSRVDAQIGPPPVIAVQPLGVSVLKGDSATFTVIAVSVTKMSYEWRLNGVRIPGGNKSYFTISNVKAGDAGEYAVLVSNAAGDVVSSNATLLVLDAPLSQVVQVLSSGMTTNGFNIQLSGPAGSNYVIMASSDLTNWTPISTNAAPTGTVDFTDTTATTRSYRYYRAVTQ